MYRILIALFLIQVLYPQFDFCQTADKEPEFNYQGLSFAHFLAKNIRHSKELKESGEKTAHVVGVKFTVNSEGNIDNIQAYMNTSDLALAEVERVLKLSNGYWSPRIRNGKAVESKPYVLPVIFVIKGKNDFANALQDCRDYFSTMPHLIFYPQCKQEGYCNYLGVCEVWAYDYGGVKVKN